MLLWMQILPAFEELLSLRNELIKIYERLNPSDLFNLYSLGWRLGLLRYPMLQDMSLSLVDTKAIKDAEIAAAAKKAKIPSLDPKHPADEDLKTILPQVNPKP